jgi:hypothetical protein
MLTPSQIATTLHAPIQAVVHNWPEIEMECAEIDGWSEHVQIAAAATIQVECPNWTPMREKYNGDPHDWFSRLYWYNVRVRADLGNVVLADSWTYCGRGYIQLTGRGNYHACGKAIGIDIEANPDLLLLPSNSAKSFAWFFQRCFTAANESDWTKVRELVNGGHNGLPEFIVAVERLKAV